MVFTMTVHMANAAFVDAPREVELARILRQYADRIERDGIDAHESRSLMDSNGNYVGQAETSGATKPRKSRRMTLRAKLQREVREQEVWMAERGTTLAGYVEFYGDPSCPNFAKYPDAGWYGSGGLAIYNADKAALDRLIAERETA